MVLNNLKPITYAETVTDTVNSCNNGKLSGCLTDEIYHYVSI